MLNGGGDLCQPTLNNKQLLHKNFPTSNTPIYQYDSILEQKDISNDEQGLQELGTGILKIILIEPTSEEAFDAWFEMIISEYKFHVNKLNINDHPIFIRLLLSLKKEQFGFSAFGLKDNINECFDKFIGYKQRYFG